ncbi:23314_t:CDS:1, partial [Dentiscutata erythropus]
QTALKLGQKTTVEEAKNALLDFLKSTNVYEKNLISKKESEINKMVENLENYFADHFYET